MSSENARPPDVAELFQELGDVLEGARDRLEALVRAAIPVQTSTAPAEPTVGSR